MITARPWGLLQPGQGAHLHRYVKRLGAAGLFLGLSACGMFPGGTKFAALDLETNEIYVGVLTTLFGEPIGALNLSGLSSAVTCEGVASTGSVGARAKATTRAMIVRCDDGRIIHGTLCYRNRTAGFGSGRDTQRAPHLFLVGYKNGGETALRTEFEALAQEATFSEVLTSDVPAFANFPSATGAANGPRPPVDEKFPPPTDTIAASFGNSIFEDDEGIERTSKGGDT